jgi:hypothetical protein
MSKKDNLPKKVKAQSKTFQDSWELAAEELLFPKDKLNYNEQELIRLKKLLIISPPPIECRKIVSQLFKTSYNY